MGLKLLVLLAILNICSGSGHRQYFAKFGSSNKQGNFSSGNVGDFGAFYPLNGNLLIGRKQKLVASSTCGIEKPEKYCILNGDRKKCFICDSRNQTFSNAFLNHRIEHIASRFAKSTGKLKTWWQSENGVENVSIELKLEAQFHLSHVIMTFKSVRPAAMLIERSNDFGRTWQVYRYFAADCDTSFRGVSKGPQANFSDVICESRYSGVLPQTQADVYFRVLPPIARRMKDPNAKEIQDLLQITNLRINFTKFHDLEGNVESKFYALYELTVRGSCFCNGHASRCLPLSGDNEPHPQQMVHPRCDCAHNTKGLHCEQCEDFYNELPWLPAVGNKENKCKRCNCNNHATSCHFDPAVFEASGQMSGGVCDNCHHNTMGKNCEECKPSFYGFGPIGGPEACSPCDCELEGSLDNNCDTVSGTCRCKPNKSGRDCSRCKPNKGGRDCSEQ